MDIGFTGSRHGMTDQQKRALSQRVLMLMSNEEQTRFRHGDCVGADEEAHNIVRAIFGVRIVVHPPDSDRLRAFCRGDVILPKADYIHRNRFIVAASRVLIAAPKEDTMQLRSGTWSTMRWAHKQKRRVIVLYPDGQVDTDFQPA